MPRKSVLTPSQKVSLLSFPTSKIEFERYYTLSDSISILVDSEVVVIQNTYINYDKILKNLKLRNRDLVLALVKNQ